MSIARRAVPLLALLLIPVGEARGARLRDEVALLAQELRQLQAQLATANSRNEELAAELARLRDDTGVDLPGRQSPADLAARLDAVDGDVRVLFENQAETQRRLSVLSDKIESLFRHQQVFGQPQSRPAVPHPMEQPMGGHDAPPPVMAGGLGGTTEPAPVGDLRSPWESSPSEPAGSLEGGWPATVPATPTSGVDGTLVSPPVDPEELFREALADHGRGEHALAMEGFEEFLMLHPVSELADDARYFMGEAALSGGQTDQAVAAFKRVLEDHPQGDKVPDASYKLGVTYLSMNRVADAILQLQRTVDRHAGTQAGRLARRKLESLGLM
ncbi:MAG: tetratricopeptide repeat protein [Acidobacteriota bacterium]